MKKAATLILFTIQWASINALDWPTYRHDAQRTGITSEQLALPLSKSWTFVSAHQPERAWPAPFRENPYSGVKVEPLLTFDHAFQPIACGNSVFFGSSSDHQVYCLDSTSGHIKWTFYTEGPVRICPTFHQGRLYFGSDDGIIYCLDAQTGRELWRHLAGPSNDKIPGNEQIISRWPVRSGVLVEKGLVYSAAGLFPAREGSYLFALDAYFGKKVWKKKINQTSQGYLLATPSKIFVPTGKLTPLMYNRVNGDYIKRISGPRGNFALIVDDVMVSGPGISGGNLVALDQANKQYRVANFKANKAVISPNSVFLASGTEIIRRDRKPLALQSLEKRKNDLEGIIKAELNWKKAEELKSKIEAANKNFHGVLDLNNRLQWQAEKFDRGNVVVDRELYGKEIGIISDPGGQKNFAEYDLTVETTGLFQLESSGVRSALKQMKPNKFEDIIALVALYRPGPMSNIPIYNDCKNGLKKPDYIHESLEKILKPTYGVIIYQEQVMQIAQTLAGFTPGEADILRKAMGKKKRKELEKQEEKFIRGAEKNNIGKDIASFIFQKIKPFAEYGFNKSHAAAYALIAYQTAYLKKYYPEDFIAATMSTELSNTDKLREFVEELKRLKIEIIRPNINQCFADFKPEKNKIYYALSGIKSVGREAISNVVKEREKNGPFKSLNNFVRRINSKDINKLQLEGLAKAGAFDSLESNRHSLLNSIPKLIQVNKSICEEKSSNQNSLFSTSSKEEEVVFSLDKVQPWSKNEMLMNEFHSIGFYMSDHPLKTYKDYFEELNIFSFNDFVNSSESNAYVAGTIMSIQEKKSAKGTPFAVIKFTDLKSEFELFLFSDLLISNREKLKAASSFILSLQKNSVSGANITRRINIKNIVPLENFVKKSYDNVVIEINGKSNLDELQTILGENGDTKIQIKVSRDSKIYIFSLKNPRKFNFNTFKNIRSKEYVKKISF